MSAHIIVNINGNMPDSRMDVLLSTISEKYHVDLRYTIFIHAGILEDGTGFMRFRYIRLDEPVLIHKGFSIPDILRYARANPECDTFIAHQIPWRHQIDVHSASILLTWGYSPPECEKIAFLDAIVKKMLELQA